MRRRQQIISEAAREMFERYGQKALEQVDQRIRELKDHQENDAVLLWQEIRSVVKCLLIKDKNGGS